MTLSEIEKSFLLHWKNIDFSSWKESDVREEFIAPLLKILGYAKGTFNDILREESLKLSNAYHRIGRKRVAIDYVPTIRLKRFWIIEAKPGSCAELSFGDFLQAHLYAIHPEIQAQYIVLTNGREIQILDSSVLNSNEEPIFTCNQENCDEMFGELKDILSRKTLGKVLRGKLIQTLESTLAVEVDENDPLCANIAETLYPR